MASSLEDEPDNPDAEDPINDNLSDMVSANVSGRGTPNVSGRDTPSSQVTEDGADDSHNRQPRNEENSVNDGNQVSFQPGFFFLLKIANCFLKIHFLRVESTNRDCGQQTEH